jgi:hypothetical protein
VTNLQRASFDVCYAAAEVVRLYDSRVDWPRLEAAIEALARAHWELQRIAETERGETRSN